MPNECPVVDCFRRLDQPHKMPLFLVRPNHHEQRNWEQKSWEQWKLKCTVRRGNMVPGHGLPCTPVGRVWTRCVPLPAASADDRGVVEPHDCDMWYYVLFAVVFFSVLGSPLNPLDLSAMLLHRTFHCCVSLRRLGSLALNIIMLPFHAHTVAARQKTLRRTVNLCNITNVEFAPLFIIYRKIYPYESSGK